MDPFLFLSSSRNCRFASLGRGRATEWKEKKSVVFGNIQLNCSKTVLGDFKSLPPVLIHRFVKIQCSGTESFIKWGKMKSCQR